MFYSGAVTSRIGKQIDQADEREKSVENDIEDLNDILSNLTDQLTEKDMTLKANAVYVDLKVRDMATFATLNKLYIASFGLMPPVRVCV